jgi:hypothetical protein
MSGWNRIAFLAAATVLAAVAQDDPPGRVGRLSYMSGSVSYRPGDVDDWVGADFNRPLTTGDHLWTDDGSRAEVHIGGAALRLGSQTAFEFLNLADSAVQVRLAQGTLSVRVRELSDQDTFEIDTPNLAFSLLRPGEYRIDVDPNNQTTTVTVRGGEGEVTGGGQAFTVHPGEQAQVSGGDTLAYNVVGAPGLDDWDQWCLSRERRADQSRSARYVSRDMVGYQDLDDYGNWRDTSDYGPVWVPTGVAAGWAPYHNGHWVWMEPWGWTWVDDAPWGFAPFHYGRWVYVGYWAWVPGPVAVRPVYAPALVAWVGNPGVAVGVGVAWFPLGPREVYMPCYHASPTYVNRVNVTNTTIVNNINITNVYNNTTFVNRNAPGAVTVVPQRDFASARPVQTVAVRVDPGTLRSVQVVNAAPVAPSRQSVLGVTPARRVAQPPAAIQSRPVVAKTPPPPPPVPFAQRQAGLASNPGRPLDPVQVQRLRAAEPAPVRPLIRQAPPANPVQPRVQSPNQPRPAGVTQTPPPPARDSIRPPQRDTRPPVQPPPQVQAPAQQTPPPRVERDVQPPVRPPDRPVEQPRRDVQPPARPPDRPVEQPRRDVQPPVRPPDRPVEEQRPQQRPEQRDVQPPPRQQQRPNDRPAPKQDKKDDKKDKKDEKKQ